MPEFLRGFSPLDFDLSGRSVLLTGGTGSFGHAFVRHAVGRLNVSRLVVFSRDELKQFEMQQLYPQDRYPQLRFFIGDVRDYERLKMAARDVDIIVHAAALKQVTALEYNPFECVQTNIHGAENIVRVAMANRVEKVLALSTDKAAEPVNLYGASKFVSDKIFTAANNVARRDDPTFSVVRYGNVANSRGSVIPFFRRLIERGTDHLPITDPRMTRFVITLDQGVEFVCLGLANMRGGEVFVPKIPSVRITDLAEAMAPGLAQKVVGTRPGEKIHEVLVPGATAHNVLESRDFLIIQPEFAYRTYEQPTGLDLAPVAEDYSYDSLNNDEYLNVGQIRELLEIC